MGPRPDQACGTEASEFEEVKTQVASLHVFVRRPPPNGKNMPTDALRTPASLPQAHLTAGNAYGGGVAERRVLPVGGTRCTQNLGAAVASVCCGKQDGTCGEAELHILAQDGIV